MRIGSHDAATRAPQTTCIRNPGDCYTVTDTLRAVGLAPGKLKGSAGLSVASLPVWMPDRI